LGKIHESDSYVSMDKDMVPTGASSKQACETGLTLKRIDDGWRRV
jgi:hypothetical protein